MTKILIVEGNSREIINANGAAGIRIASDCYRETLAYYAADAVFDVSIPFAPDLQNREININDYDAFALTGSGVEWSSGDKEIKPYLDHLEKTLATGKPIIGSCWGMQTVVQLMGGNCLPNDKGTEVGLAEDISLKEKGRAHWIFDGLPDVFPSPCIHRDHVVDLPESFDLLASNEVSEVQAVAYNGDDFDFVGFQFHPEFDLPYIHALINRRGGLNAINSPIASFPENLPEIVTNTELRTRVFSNWLDYVEKKKKATEIAA